MPLGSWLRVGRHRRWMAAGLEASQQAKAEFLPFWARLAPEERRRLSGLARIFEESKNWEGCGGLEMSEEIKCVVAVQACRLILRLQQGDPPGEPFPHVRTILVHPSSFHSVHEIRGADGSVGRRASWNLGEAWQDGKVVLAWDSAYQGGRQPHDGHNLVIHEFAHQLDLLDGEADGLLWHPDPADAAHWRSVLVADFERFRTQVENGRKSALDPYGATSPAEFFAVASENFFERPGPLRMHHPQLYAALAGYYRQDPLIL